MGKKPILGRSFYPANKRTHDEMIRTIETNIKELKKPCDPVLPGEDITEIVKDLEETFAARNGYGLAAPQISVKKKLAIVKFGKTKINLVNPVIIAKEDKFTNKGECCFSVGNGKLPVDTDRYNSIIYKNGLNWDCYTAQGLEAVVIQHEIDHLNGITILDRKHRRK